MPKGSDCPTTSVLERLLLGQISPDEAESLEAHVLECPRCGQAMKTIAAVDELVAAMEQVRAEAVAKAPEAAEALIPWLKRLRPKEATQTVSIPTGSGDTPAIALTAATYDFLGNPESTDELGRLAQYRVLQSIGVGGMGMVFLAEDTRLRRQVALKVVKPELLERPDLHERFLQEARAIAAVEHDNIVTIYEAGEVMRVPYLVMPLLRGQSLEDRLKRAGEPLPIDEVLRIGREIASGLDAAHQRGLIHRDIKPSNLWLEAPSPRVKILDFGLARTVEGVSGEQAGTILGTPAYMSPEQARGLPVDVRSDLFSLGCVMYRMATGQMPFQGKDIITTLLSVTTETPVSPKVLNPELPADLVAVIDKLLAKKPEDRFASAQEVVAAIERIAERRRPRRIGRWLAALAAGLALAIGGTLGISAYLHRPPPPVEVTLDFDEPDTVLLLQRQDEAEQEIDVGQKPRLLLAPGTYQVRTKAEHPGRQLLPARFVIKPAEPAVVPLRLVGLIRTYHGHTLPIEAVALAPGNQPLALTASKDRSIGVWSTAADDAGFFLPHDSWVHCVALSPDGKLALSGSGMPGRKPDNSVRLWDLVARKCLDTLSGHQSAVTAVAFDPRGKTLLSGDMDGRLFFWDAQTRQQVDDVPGHDHLPVHALAFLPDGTQALSGGGDGKLLLWDVAKRQVLKTFAAHPAAVTGVSVAPEGREAATCSLDGTIRIWDLQTAASRALLGGGAVHEGGVQAVAWSPDGKRLLSGGWDGMVRLWDAGNGELIQTFAGHHKSVHGVAFSADGRRAVSGGADAKLCLWELPR